MNAYGDPKKTRFCAFCKHWYDPTNTAISPRSGNTTVWDFDRNIKNKCLDKNIERVANMGCNKYECKL